MFRLRFTIGRRLALLGCIGLAVALLSNGASLLLGSRVTGYQDEELSYQKGQQLVRELDTRAGELKVDGYKALLSETPGDELSEVKDDTLTVTERLDKLDKLKLRGADQKIAVTLRSSFTNYVDAIDAIISGAIKDPVGARASFGGIQNANDATDAAVGKAVEQFDAASAKIQKESKDTSSLLVVTTSLMFGIGAAIVLVATIVLSRSTSRRVGQLVGALGQAAEGDLSTRLPDEGGDEISDMARALNAALDKIGEVFSRITGTAEKLAKASTSLEAVASEHELLFLELEHQQFQ